MSLKTSKELDERYKEACKCCMERHFKIFGCRSSGCAWKNFDNEYCPDIEIAERLRAENSKSEQE